MLETITLKAIDDFFQPSTNQVDELGRLDRQIKELEAQARKIKAALIAQGAGKYEGLEFFAEVQHYDRATINPILVRELCDEEIVRQVTQVRPVDAVVVKRLTA
jgi:predicted chitinase